MSSVNSINANQTDNRLRNTAIGAAGVAVAWEAEPYIKKWLSFPARSYITTAMKKTQGGGYLPYLEKAIKQNNLEKNLKFII